MSLMWHKSDGLEQHIFTFKLIIEGANEKVLQFIIPLKFMYNKNVGFSEQKCIFENRGSVKNIQNGIIF
jgi:hypothetical protein